MLKFRDRTGIDSDDDEELDYDPGEYPSLDSLGSGPTSETSPASPDSSLSPRPLGSPGGNNTPRSTNSPPSTGPVSLAESMQLVDEILANGSLDRMDRIEKLESILSAACLEQVENRGSARSRASNVSMVDAETQVGLSRSLKYYFYSMYAVGHSPSHLLNLSCTDLATQTEIYKI